MRPSRRTLLVVGPPLAGVTAVVGALRDRLPGTVVVDADGSPPEWAPDVVLAVLSAAAPLTRSDWAPVTRAAAGGAPVVAVVAKVDAHRAWRAVLTADRALVESWDRPRGSIPWLGVAAAPGVGVPRIDELVELLGDLSPYGGGRPRTTRAPDGALTRRVLQHVRLQLLRFVRDESTAVRSQLREAAAAVRVGGAADFEALVAAQVEAFHERLTEEITGAVDAAAVELRMTSAPASTSARPEVSRPSSSSRRLEGRLMAVLGVGFGLGIALAAGRLLAGLAPGLSAPGMAAGAVAGAALVCWVVRARGLLHDRALLDRWVVEVGATLRWHGEAMVAEQLLTAESAWLAVGVDRARAMAPERSPNAGRASRVIVTDQYEWC